ncbi:MAG: LysE family translocator [Actinomycetota bacterium]|nr:LysE family translocator [Actinomycetota bacterium]
MLTESILAFALVAGLVTVTPGADTMLVLSAATRDGATCGLATAGGTISGLYCWGIAAATGASAVLTASEAAYTLLRIAGALYLFWLGLKAARSMLRPLPQGDAAEATDEPGVSLRRAYARGLLTNLLNPKIGAFYISFLPQFLPVDAPTLPAGLLLASVHAVEGLLFLGSVSLLAHRAGRWLRRPRVSRALDGICAAVFLGFGARLALSR